ncbi:MAG: DNA (cytosine-5-)-methyltransferase [Bacteroidales bacterium]
MIESTFTIQEISNLLDVSIPRLQSWEERGKLVPLHLNENNEKLYSKSQLALFEDALNIFESSWDEECKTKPKREYKSIELFAGAGGMAIGFEKAGIGHLMLNEVDKDACATLRKNRPDWNVVEGDIRDVDFTPYKGKVDVVTGGFPCQAFSYAGKKMGFEDTRGTLFFDFARCVKEVEPIVLVAENVKGLVSHDNGKTLEIICNTIKEIGYTLIQRKVFKAMYYKVPQKRERLILIAIRNDYADRINEFKFPSPYPKVLTLEDAFKKGELYDCDVPESDGAKYPKKKKEIMDLVPEGGYWKDLPIELQKEYMGGSFYLGGGKTGLARRLSMSAPSLTVVCSPAMKQTERCHPTETRPLTIRESARIQTFPDEWKFSGSQSHAYKQIGNALPVNLAWAIARSVVRFLNKIEA